MKTLVPKTLAALLILSIVTFTFATAPSVEANCWLSLLACLSAAEDAYEKCKEAGGWSDRIKCALALSKAITVCWNAYDDCFGSSS